MLKQRSFWVPVVCGILILGLGTGTRQSFGIFQMAIAADFGVGRELWSFANALSFLLMGLCAPFVGALADRFGTAKSLVWEAYYMCSGFCYLVLLIVIGF